MSMVEQVRARFDADRRLSILRILLEYGETANTSTLEKAVFDLGFRTADRAMMLDDSRWLAARSLVCVEELKKDLLLLTLTETGVRVARGEKRVEGVSRPSGE